MATGVLDVEQRSPAPLPRRRAEYALSGQARAGGAYNSHLVSVALFVVLAAAGWMNAWLVAWLVACMLAALLVDERPWRRKVSPGAMPGQVWLYLQVLFQAACDAFPFYVLAYALYVCTAPIVLPTYIAISSFVMLYAFYMIVRAFWLVVYMWRLGFRWETAGRTFAVHEANLNSRGAAMRHVLWGYFLGNIGLVVRCGIQVVTIGGFEWLRQRFDMDLLKYPAAACTFTRSSESP